MFFAQGEVEKLPEELRKEIDKLGALECEIYKKYKEGKTIDYLVLKYTIESLKIFLKFYKKYKISVRKMMEDAIGEIPIIFFVDDQLKVNKELEDVISELVDMDQHVRMDKVAFAKEVMKKLKKLESKIVPQN